VGTHTKPYQIFGSEVENITPFRKATSEFGGMDSPLNQPFTTTGASGEESIITVSHTGHGRTVGDTIYLSTATGETVGGIQIEGEYTVLEVIDGNTYKFAAGEDASGTDNGPTGMSVEYAYEINIGKS